MLNKKRKAFDSKRCIRAAQHVHDSEHLQGVYMIAIIALVVQHLSGWRHSLTSVKMWSLKDFHIQSKLSAMCIDNPN